MSGVPDYPLGETLDFKFTTRSFSTGAPTTLAGTPVVQVYEDNSTTQITAGITLTVDFDSVTGLNNLRIVATSGNGYGSGQSYQAVISTGTVGGVSVVGEVVKEFTIERSPGLRPTTAGRTLDVTATGAAGIDWGNIENPTTTVDLSGTDINLVDTTTTNTDMRGTDNAALASVLGALADAAAAGDPTSADTVMQYVKQLVNVLVGTTGITTFPAEASPANNVSLAEVIRAIHSDTNSLNDTKVPDTISLANINSEVDTAISDVNLDHLVGTSTGIPAIPSGTYIDQMMDDGTATFDRTTDSLQAIRDRGDAAWTTGAAGSGLTALASGTAQGGTASTIQLASGETFANDELNGNVVKITSGTGNGQSRVITDYVGSTDTATVSPNWTTNPDATSVYEVVEGSVNLTVIQNDAQSVTDLKDFADAGYDPGTNQIEGVKLVDTTTTNSDMRGTDNAALASVLGALADAAAAGDPTATDTVVAYVKQIVNTLEGTTGIPTFPAAATPANNVSMTEVLRQIYDEVAGLDGAAMRGTDGANTTTPPTAASIADAVWDEDATVHQTQGTFGQAIGDPGADSDTIFGLVNTNLDATVGSRASQTTADAIETDTQDIQSRLPSTLVGGRMDSNVGAVSGSVGAADKMEESFEAVITGTVGVGSSTTSIVISSTNPSLSVNDQVNGKIVTFTDATTTAALRGQSTDITDYVQSTATMTVTALTTAPASGDTFVIT